MLESHATPTPSDPDDRSASSHSDSPPARAPASQMMHDLRQPLNVAILQLTLAGARLESFKTQDDLSSIQEPVAGATTALRELGEAIAHAEKTLLAAPGEGA